MPRPLTASEFDQFREQLCAVATRLVLERGVEGFSMRTLAQELGCSPMRAYRYFRSKEELIAALRTQAFDRFAEALEQAKAAAPDLRAAVIDTSEAYAKFAADNPWAYRLMFEMGPTRAEGFPDLARASARARKTMTETVIALIEAGELSGDAAELGRIFWSGLHGVTILSVNGLLEVDDPTPIRRKIMAAIYRGLTETQA